MKPCVSSPEDAAAGADPGAHRTGVPVPLTRFVGRERDLHKLRSLLSEHRLVSLVGPGGGGKTRLAIEALRRPSGQPAPNVRFVDLAPLADGSLVEPTLAAVLAVRAGRGAALPDALIGYLRPRSFLLVLDNCEHLIAACARLTERLLQACPQLRLLTTSRAPLAVPGETVMTVTPLSTPRRTDLPAPVELHNLEQYDAVRLLADRVSAVRPDWSLDVESAATIAELTTRLAGLPLAIELAAAAARTVSLPDVLRHLDRMLQHVVGARTLPPRQQTMQATIDWSYHRLSPTEQAVFCGLSVFAGTFTLAAAQAVCAALVPDGDVLPRLLRLVDTSLIVADTAASETRFQVLEPLRRYARALVDDATATALRRRHAAYFQALALDAQPHLSLPDRSVWLAVLDDHYDNLRLVLGRVCDPQGSTGGADAVQLTGALWWFWFHRGYWSEGRSWLQQALDSADGDASVGARARAQAWLGLGVLAWAQGDAPAAHRALETCVALARGVGDVKTLGYALLFWGQDALGRDEMGVARALADESVEVFMTLDDMVGRGLAVTSLGVVALFGGDEPAAQRHLEHGAELLRAAGDSWALALPLRNLGYLAYRRGAFQRAAELQRASLASLRDLDEQWFTSRSLELLAETLAALGAWRRSTRLLGASEAMREAVGAAVLPYYQAAYDHSVAAIRAQLDPHTLAAEWQAGRDLSLRAAIDEALMQEPRPEVAQPVVSLLRLYALGRTAVQCGDRSIEAAAWSYSRPRDLLFLLASRGRCTREAIGAALWPEASSEQLRRNLGVALHHLRRTLGSADWVVFDTTAYVLNRAAGVWFDAEAFAQLLTAAQGASDDCRAVELLSEAVALYSGDFLPDTDAAWTTERREELRRLFGDALLRLGGLLETTGRAGAAAEVYRRAVAHDAYREAAHRGLMRALAASGERAGALRHYRVLADLLRAELDAVPDAETTALYRALAAA